MGQFTRIYWYENRRNALDSRMNHGIWLLQYLGVNIYIYIYIGSRWSGDWHSWGGSFWILLSLLILIHEKIYKNRASCFGSRSTPYFNLNVNDPCIKMLQIWRFQLPLGSSLPTSHAKRALIRCSENHWMVGPSLSFDHRSSPKVTF